MKERRLIMNSPFETLCQSLKLDLKTPSQQALTALHDWYKDQISDDLYANTEKKVDAVRSYLDVFLPNLSPQLADSVPAFDNMNAIEYAAAHGYSHFLEKLKQSDDLLVNVSIPHNKMTPLHLAAVHGHVPTVEILLQHGASPYQKNNADELPIQSALFTPLSHDENYLLQQTIIFKILKSAAPDTLSAKNKSGETVLQKMAMHGYTKLVADAIQENPALIFEHDNFLKYPIHYAILNNNTEIVQLLMAVDKVATMADMDDCLALHYAAKVQGVTMLTLCFPFYQNVDPRDLHKRTPLLCAAEVGNLSGLIALKDKKADMHATDYKGFTVLHYAVHSGTQEMVRWIIKNRAVDINAQDYRGYTALYYAKQQSQTEIVTLLEENKAVR